MRDFIVTTTAEGPTLMQAMRNKRGTVTEYRRVRSYRNPTYAFELADLLNQVQTDLVPTVAILREAVAIRPAVKGWLLNNFTQARCVFSPGVAA